jgi:hypothetical protein
MPASMHNTLGRGLPASMHSVLRAWCLWRNPRFHQEVKNPSQPDTSTGQSRASSLESQKLLYRKGIVTLIHFRKSLIDFV